MPMKFADNCVLHISIYWSDWIGAVKKADKQTGLNEVEIFSGVVPRGIYIFKQQSMQFLYHLYYSKMFIIHC